MTDSPSRPDTTKAVAHLREELRDATCTAWTCLDCGWSEYKAYGLECDQCGFDAAPFVPLDHLGLPIVRVPAETSP